MLKPVKGIFVGLDISTSCTGVALMHPDGKLDSCVFELSSYDEFYDKFRFFTQLWSPLGALTVEKICIEEPLLSFSQGKSTASTLAMLQRMNGAISCYLSQQTGLDPIHIHVSTVRRLCGFNKKYWATLRPAWTEKMRFFEYALNCEFSKHLSWRQLAIDICSSSAADNKHKGVDKRWYDEIDALAVLYATTVN